MINAVQVQINKVSVNTALGTEYSLTSNNRVILNYKDSDKIKYMQNLHYDPTTFDADYDANGTDYQL